MRPIALCFWTSAARPAGWAGTTPCPHSSAIEHSPAGTRRRPPTGKVQKPRAVGLRPKILCAPCVLCVRTTALRFLILQQSVVASASEWTNHRSLAFATTGKSKSKGIRILARQRRHSAAAELRRSVYSHLLQMLFLLRFSPLALSPSCCPSSSSFSCSPPSWRRSPRRPMAATTESGLHPLARGPSSAQLSSSEN